MKLHQFTASSNQKALSMVHEALGPDALIYSSRDIANGVEIVAARPDDFGKHDENEMFEKLNAQLQFINDSVKNLKTHVDRHLHDGLDFHDDEQATKRNELLYQLNKLGFKGKFCYQFINNYFKTRFFSGSIKKEDIEADLFNAIQTTNTDVIDGKNICALIGPTGIGKTTTILKLAKRYISRYGSDSLGVITTDYHDISGKNMLIHYQHLYNFNLEYAESAADLSLVINAMKNKNLILIDTHGSSQKDRENVARLVNLMESQGNKISPYIVLPSNVQEPILDEIARVFKTTNLAGCIFTKLDECISLAQAVSVAIQHQMKIAYICDGQDINKDIQSASKEKILYQILSESSDREQDVGDELIRSSC